MMAWSNPEMAKHATRLGEVMRFNTIFPAKLSEIAILVTARHFTAHYEWFAHKRLALKGGMDPKSSTISATAVRLCSTIPRAG